MSRASTTLAARAYVLRPMPKWVANTDIAVGVFRMNGCPESGQNTTES